MEKAKIFVTCLASEDPVLGLDPFTEEVLRKDFELITAKSVKENPDLFLDIQGACTYYKWEPEQTQMLKAAPNLKVISNHGVGINHIDFEFCKSRGIKVGYTPESVKHATADMAFGLLLATARGFRKGLDIATSGHAKQIFTKEVHGSTLGIVGMGRIGSLVARRALGFDMKVLYHNRNQRRVLEQELNAEYCNTLHDMLPRCDFVVISCPLTSETKDMFTAKEFMMMKNDAVVVNVARGGLINTDDLVMALRENMIGGAGLDVTEPAILPANHPLLQMENVFVMPHWCWTTVATREKMARDVAANLRAVIIEGKSPVFEISR